MRVVNLEELTVEDLNSNHLVKTFDLNNPILFNMLKNLSEDDCKELTGILNKINNQGILNIDSKKIHYTIKDANESKILPLVSMSTSESIFFICYIANKCKSNMIILDGISQLTRKTCKLFSKIFKNSKYITIAIDGEYLAEYWRDLLIGD